MGKKNLHLTLLKQYTKVGKSAWFGDMPIELK